jgi:sugar phosphate permease
MLPFVFLLYVVAYIDRVNVSFATLKMSVDLGFSDRVYGLGVGIFYVGYILLEIPGAIIAERWSPRKWISRIMITWGALTTAAMHDSILTSHYSKAVYRLCARKLPSPTLTSTTTPRRSPKQAGRR